MKKITVPRDFDWKIYLKLNPDVASTPALNNEWGAQKHWVTQGYKEGRPYKKEQQPIPTSEQLKNKIVVFTCITDGYDVLRDVLLKDRAVDYICYTNTEIKSGTWDVRPMPTILDGVAPTKRCRAIKINPHVFLDDYDISLWVDGNIQIIGSALDFIQKTLVFYSFYTAKHPRRICTYQEGIEVAKLRKEIPGVIEKQMNKYKREGFPTNHGLCQTGILLRRHNDPDIIKLDSEWWQEVLRESKRDQLSFNYTCWKNKNIGVGTFNPHIISSKYFQYWSHTNGTTIKLPDDYGNMDNYINGIKV